MALAAPHREARIIMSTVFPPLLACVNVSLPTHSVRIPPGLRARSLISALSFLFELDAHPWCRVTYQSLLICVLATRASGVDFRRRRSRELGIDVEHYCTRVSRQAPLTLELTCTLLCPHNSSIKNAITKLHMNPSSL
jgi:hypothetical protein